MFFDDSDSDAHPQTFAELQAPAPKSIFTRVVVVTADFRRGRMVTPVKWRGAATPEIKAVSRAQMQFIGSVRADVKLNKDKDHTACAAMLECAPDMVPEGLRYGTDPIVVSVAPRKGKHPKLAIWALNI